MGECKKRAEQELQRSKAQLETAVRSIQHRILGLESEYSDKVFYSREWKNQIGYAEDEIGDCKHVEWVKRLHPDDKARVEQTAGRRPSRASSNI